MKMLRDIRGVQRSDDDLSLGNAEIRSYIVGTLFLEVYTIHMLLHDYRRYNIIDTMPYMSYRKRGRANERVVRTSYYTTHMASKYCYGYSNA